MQVLSPNNQDISISSGHIEPSQPDVRNVTEAQPIEIEDSTKISDDIDPLDKFLPSPPTDKCSEELQVIFLLLVQLFSTKLSHIASDIGIDNLESGKMCKCLCVYYSYMAIKTFRRFYLSSCLD